MCHVLIIEDDPLFAADVQLTVQEAGATSFSFADTHKHAVACARETLPGLIISDVMLAEGYGPEAVWAIHAEHGVIPVIFITGTPEHCHGCDPEHVLEKPFCPDRLTTLFQELRPH